MKNFLELAKSRRSVRQYGPEEISHEQIEKIIEAGIWAPSAMNKQPIKFFILQNPSKIRGKVESWAKYLASRTA